MGTFHAVCARILRREVHHLGLDSNFAIYDDADQMNVVKRVLKDLELDEKRYPARPFLNAISSAKSELKVLTSTVSSARATGRRWPPGSTAAIRRLLTENRAMDFDDLLMVTEQLFRSVPEVLRSDTGSGTFTCSWTSSRTPTSPSTLS